MIAFPNCKINLGLHVRAKRADGFHDLETIFYPIAWKDVIEVVADRDHPVPAARHSPNANIQVETSGLEISGPPQENLCVRAYELLKKDFPDLPRVRLHLHKTIPMGAGLGGGSADGAFTLLLLNEKFQLGLSTDELIPYALQLGSDCPFFILNKPCYATGRGERLQPLQLNLKAYLFVIVNPGIHVNTGWAFQQLTPARLARPINQIIAQPVTTWREDLINDFEIPVCRAFPPIADIKRKLDQAGAIYSSMTGTGSTVFGIFGTSEKVNFDFPQHYRVKHFFPEAPAF